MLDIIGDRLAKFAAQSRLKTFVSNDLTERTENPIQRRLLLY